MTEPTTEAGRALYRIGMTSEVPYAPRDILAIEAEARAQAITPEQQAVIEALRTELLWAVRNLTYPSAADFYRASEALAAVDRLIESREGLTDD